MLDVVLNIQLFGFMYVCVVVLLEDSGIFVGIFSYYEIHTVKGIGGRKRSEFGRKMNQVFTKSNTQVFSGVWV